MNFERRDYELEIRMNEDASRISGYAAVFNEDSYDLGGFKERLAPGAFKRVLNRGDNVLGLFNHSLDHLLATRDSGTLRLEEDEVGLRYEFDLDPSDPDHQRVIAKVKRGDLKGSSFAFRTTPDTDEWTTGEGDYPMRIVHDVAALRDVGPVTAPAYGATENVGKKLALRSLADLVDKPVEELVEASALRDFLLSVRGQETPDVAADDTSKNDVPSTDERVQLPAAPPSAPDWYQTYLKE